MTRRLGKAQQFLSSGTWNSPEEFSHRDAAFVEHRRDQLSQVEPDVWDVDGDVFGHLQDLVEPEDKQRLNIIWVLCHGSQVGPTLYSTALLAGCRLSPAGVTVDPCAPWRWCCAPAWTPVPVPQTRTAARCCSAPARTAGPPVGTRGTLDICSRTSDKQACALVEGRRVYLCVVNVDVLLNDGDGLLAHFVLVQGGLAGSLWRRGGDGRLPFHCAHKETKTPVPMSDFKTQLATDLRVKH